MNKEIKLERKNSNNILLVANYESDVGYAWWLMENYWVEISRFFCKKNRLCFLIYPKINTIPAKILDSSITVLEHDFKDKSKQSLCRLKNVVLTNNITSIYLTDKNYYDFYYLVLRTWGIKKIVNHDHWGIKDIGSRDHSLSKRRFLSLVKKIIFFIIAKIGLFSCSYYIGVSNFVRESLINNVYISPKRCSYVLNGIDPIKIQEKYNYYTSELFDIHKNSIIIVTIGRASFYKGIDFLIKCANILINEKKEHSLYFIHCGDGPDLYAFKNMSKKYGLTKRFIFAGKRNDIRQILQSCHIGIQASLGEAFSLAVLEYMSAGLAALAPNNTGNKEAISDGENGILYPPGDLEYVTEMLQTLAHNPLRREQLGHAAEQSVKEKFNIKRTSAEFIELIADKL